MKWRDAQAQRRTEVLSRSAFIFGTPQAYGG
jgi:hypothetical protein